VRVFCICFPVTVLFNFRECFPSHHIDANVRIFFHLKAEYRIVFYGVRIYHIFFNNSLIDGKLAWFHILAHMNITAVSKARQKSQQSDSLPFFTLCHLISREVTGSYGTVLVFKFWGTSKQFDILFSIFSAMLMIIHLFDNRYSNKDEVVHNCGSDVHFLISLMISEWCFCIYLLTIYILRMSVQGMGHFLNGYLKNIKYWIFLLLSWVSCVFWTLTSYHM
jgi:hypothetical protein